MALGDTPCTSGRGLLACIVGFLAFSKLCGQKMANMSTVASSVAYRPHKLIDITANMFINDSAYQSVIELFDQLRGACKPCGQHLRRVWLLLKRLQYSFLPFFDHRPGRG